MAGSYTTLSTFARETVRLLEEGAVGTVRNAAGTFLGGGAAATAGLAVAAL